MKQLVQDTIEVAMSQNGVREVGNNRGVTVSRYLASVGLGPGYPWCAAFLYWAMQQAAQTDPLPNPFVRSASTGVVYAWASSHDLLANVPQVGDVFLRGVSTGDGFVPHHTGLVTGVDGATFTTVEGNTNIDGSDDGIGVFLKTHNNGNNFRFVRWSQLVAEPDGETYALLINGTKVTDMPVIGGRSLCPIKVWAEFMGFRVDWNNDHQSVLFDGQEVAAEIVVMNGMAYAPVRELIASAGLTLKSVDTINHLVNVIS